MTAEEKLIEIQQIKDVKIYLRNAQDLLTNNSKCYHLNLYEILDELNEHLNVLRVELAEIRGE